MDDFERHVMRWSIAEVHADSDPAGDWVRYADHRDLVAHLEGQLQQAAALFANLAAQAFALQAELRRRDEGMGPLSPGAAGAVQ